MRSSRITSFDYIRVVSIIGILICHSLTDTWLNAEWLGRLLGMTFNFLFLILSAFLFGISWENKNYEKYDVSFITKRLRKLSKSYYPYLVVLFVFLYLTQDFFSFRKILTHFLYLPWFDKVTGFGRLWFLSMIAICYIGCVAFTRFPHNKLGVSSSSLLFIASVFLGYFSMQVGIPGYIFPYLTGYLLVFKYARVLLLAVGKIPLLINILQVCSVSFFNVIYFDYYNLSPYGYLGYLLGILQAISIFCFLYNICTNIKESKIILFLSGVSFEIYLVHEFFLGKFSVYNYIENPLLSFLVFVSLSIFTGYILNLISKKLLN